MVMATMPMVHKPTLGTAVVIVVALFILYHFTLGKKK
jgi:hypothetical protein